MTLTLPSRELRAPAWGRLPANQKVEGLASASESFAQLGAYDVELAPVYIGGPDQGPFHGPQMTRDPRHQAIRRTDTGEVFDIVSKNYTLISPRDFATRLDEHVPGEVECFAHMNGGRKQLAVYKLPAFAVAGDPMESHLIFVNDMSGYRAIRAMVGVYRGLCLNGQVFFEANGVGKIFHDRKIEANFLAWLEYIPHAAHEKANAMKEVYEILASERVNPLAAARVVDQVYALPSAPSSFGPWAEVEQREQRYETERARIITIRGEALALYEGAGTGMSHPACAGTAWGLLQAFTELEEYRPGRLVAESNLSGERQRTKQRAFTAIADLVGLA